jgi:4-amino-4-deoxy-L-arabinose transferase-like glycosyltransferase
MLRISRPAVGVFAAVVALMVVSSVAHLWSLHRDLPLTDPDEATFVTPAVHMAASGDLNPHWFGHPGSTVIYPLAGLFHAWDALAHGPLLSSNPALTARLDRSPTTFYVIGRLWTIALSVGALPLLFLVGRRAFNTRVGLIAAAIWAVLPLPVQFGRVVRTDSAGVFFGLLALWLCLRLLDEPRIRWCVLAGLSVGLAVASRYFMVALVPVLVAAAVLPHRGALRRAVGSSAVALASAVGGFAVSTPFFFLDWRTALDSLTVEDSGAPGAHSSSPLGNLHWYLRVGIPESMTWPLVVLAFAGLVLVVWRPRTQQLLLVAYCAFFLAGICLSAQHTQRWVIQLLPVLALLAAFSIDVIGRALAGLTARFAQTSIVTPVALAAITSVLIFHPVASLIDANADSTTRSAARAWIVTHLSAGTRIVENSNTVPLGHTRFAVNYSMNPHTHTLDEYQHAGYQYLVANSLGAAQYKVHPRLYSHELAFYLDLVCHTRRVVAFDATTTRAGWTISIFRLREAAADPSQRGQCSRPQQDAGA